MQALAQLRHELTSDRDDLRVLTGAARGTTPQTHVEAVDPVGVSGKLDAFGGLIVRLPVVV